MASRRILSNSNLAPIQEVSVNPYSSFNSDQINKLTRVVSGGKDKDVVVNGLDVCSRTDKKWYAGPNLIPKLNSEVWTGHNYYVLDEDRIPVVHFELPHQESYGFSYISCPIDDSCVNHLYKSSYPKIYEVTFKLDFGTPKTIVAKLNDCEVTIDHPVAGKEYVLPLTKIFKNDTLAKGLTFTIGAVLDGADPECKFETSGNKTYIVMSHIGFRMKGYEFPEFSRSPGPIEHEYALYGIHPTHTIEITPGVAIKDDVMLEELSPSIDKFKKHYLDLTKTTSWIKNNPFVKTDFAGTQTAYQCNDNSDVYKARECRVVDGELQVCISDHDSQPKWIRPTDDIVLTYDIEGNNLDRQFAFDRYTDDDEFHNFTLYSDGAVLDSVASHSSTVIVCFLDDDGQYRIIGYKKNIVKGGQGVKAPNIDPETEDETNINVDEQARNITFDNGSSFEIPILSYTLPKKISDYGNDWRNRIRGFVSIGPTKVSGHRDCYNVDAVKWGYVVLYYAYFKNPKPNTSYIGLIRDTDLEAHRDDYLILAKVRFVDPTTVDIISYEDRQQKQIPTAEQIRYDSTCTYPEIWDGDVPETVTDAINKLALFDHNFSRAIRFKHDFDAAATTTMNLVHPNGRAPQMTPYIHVNNDGHLERKLRITKKYLTLGAYPDAYKRYLPEKGVRFESENDVTFTYTNPEGEQWRIRFDPILSDIPLADEFGLKVKAAFGKYDPVSHKINYAYICFNSFGPFQFVDVKTGNVVCDFDWNYQEEILLYPTAPGINLDSQTLLYPTAPYSTIDERTGMYVDVDKGVLASNRYLDDDNGLQGGRFLLSYDDPTPQSEQSHSTLNSKENHFSYLMFRNRLLISNYFLKMLDILPKISVGKDEKGSIVFEGLINNRLLQGSDCGDGSQPHIESTKHTLAESMVDGNFLFAENVNENSDIIKASIYSVPNFKSGAYDDPVYSYVKEGANYQLIDEAILVAKRRDLDTIDIISSNYVIKAKGDKKILTSSAYEKNDLIQIDSTNHGLADSFINGNLIRAKATEEGDVLESTEYAIPNKMIGEGNPYSCQYDFTAVIADANYTLIDEALLMAKKRNDNTIDIISTKFTIQVSGRGQVLVSRPYGALTSIESSKHYISESMINGNFIIGDKYGDSTVDDELKSSKYAIPDTKSGDSHLDPIDDVYGYNGTGSYKLKDGALLTAKKRNDNTVDIISSKFKITALGDKKIVIGEYEDKTDKFNSLINLKSSEFTVGDLLGHWYLPKVELRADSWWTGPRIVLVIDTIHDFTIRVSQIVDAIDKQIKARCCYGDDLVIYDDTLMSKLFNMSISSINQQLCEIFVVVDLTNGNNREKYFDERDGYTAIESLCKSKLIIVNDVAEVHDGDKTYKPYIKMHFDYSDSIKAPGATSHADGEYIVPDFDIDKVDDEKNRSAEHMHHERLMFVAGGDKPYVLADGWEDTDKNIVWNDHFRGYNNTKISEEGKDDEIRMNMYPVADKEDDTNVSAKAYDPASTLAKSGYEFCRGPLTYVYAGSKGEYVFNHVKTIPDVDDITYPMKDDHPLFTCTKSKDVLYIESKYYVTEKQF